VRIRSSSPFWPIRDGLVFAYPALDQDISCEVVVIGGGLSGAMIGYYLAEANVDTVLLDKRDIGLGSTSASTALVMYETDKSLTELRNMRGEEFARRSYILCLESVHKIEQLVRKLDLSCGLEKRTSLYVADTKKDASDLEEEYVFRRKCGIRLDYVERRIIEKNFSFSKPAALHSYDAAQLDPYLLTYGLLNKARRHLRVFDRTEVVDFHLEKNGVTIFTDRGFKVKARKVVFAAGFETMKFFDLKTVKLKSTFAIATEPVKEFRGWGFDQCLIWETARPYMYMRTTEDRRIVVGGEDEDFVNPTRRDSVIPLKARNLLNKLKRMFPSMDLEIGYAWAGTFAETVDSLPYIGEPKGFPNTYLALCYGANGTNFALMAAEIIRDLYLKKPNPNAELLGLDR
jgi:glycine/D-amino acid oxidase-like deaminating enzyme